MFLPNVGEIIRKYLQEIWNHVPGTDHDLIVWQLKRCTAYIILIGNITTIVSKFGLESKAFVNYNLKIYFASQQMVKMVGLSKI